MNTPNPQLMALYGTDTLYRQNLERAFEKRAASTVFGEAMQRRLHWPWAQLTTTSGSHQAGIDHQRQEAAEMNHMLAEAEADRMHTPLENMGGPGSQRQMYVRALQTQPYNLSPLLPAMQDPGMLHGGMHHVDSGVPQQALEGMFADASKTAQAMGRMLAKYAAEGEGVDYGGTGQAPPTMETPQLHRGRAAGASLGNAVEALGTGAGELAMSTGHAAIGTGQAIGRGLGAAGAGFRDWMSQEHQPQGTRWGTGMAPGAQTNEYGQVIY